MIANNLVLTNLFPPGTNPLVPLLAVAAITTIILVIAYLLVRNALDRVRESQFQQMYGPNGVDESLIRPEVLAEQRATGWSNGVDHQFDAFIKQTGLNWTAGQALGLMSLMSVILAGGLFLWRDDLLLVALGLLLGQVIPVVGYVLLRRRQRQKLQDQLPDALFLLARTLRAGLSLEQSLQTVAKHGAKPLADEFRRSSEEIRLGLPVAVSLQGMSSRIRLADFNIFVTAVNLHRTMGGNLTVLLDRVATAVRDRNLFRGYFQAATALGRLTAIIIACAAPALFIGYSVWQPDLVTQFVQSATGMRALGIALGLEVLGCAWLYYVLRQDY